MAIDFTKLTAAVDRNTKAVEALLAAHAAAQPDPAEAVAQQAALNAVADALDAESLKVETSLPPPTAAEP